MSETRDNLEQYLGMLAQTNRFWVKVREHELGSFRTIRQFSPDEMKYLKAITRDSKIKECYYNAQRYALFYADLTYVEGFVWPASIPIPVDHAWVEYNGAVVEVTLRPEDTHDVMIRTREGGLIIPTVGSKQWYKAANRIKPVIQPRQGDAYWGVAIPKKIVQATWMREQTSRPNLLDYAESLGLLEGLHGPRPALAVA